MDAPLAAWPWDNLGMFKVCLMCVFWNCFQIVALFFFFLPLISTNAFDFFPPSDLIQSMCCMDHSSEKLYTHGFMKINELNIGASIFWSSPCLEDWFISYGTLSVTCFSLIVLARLINGESISSRLIMNGTGTNYYIFFFSFPIEKSKTFISLIILYSIFVCLFVFSPLQG